MARTAVFVSYRLGGTDGVSVEAAKWAQALRRLGFRTRRVAGEIAGDPEPDDPAPDDLVLPWMRYDRPAGPPRPDELRAALAGTDLVIVENVGSLPLALAIAGTVAQVVGDHPGRVVLHHHDLPWQRAEIAAVTGFPPDLPGALHVTVNDRSRRELADRGIVAHTVYNTVDLDAPPGARAETRAAWGFGADDIVLLQPTRAIPRKGIPRGLAFAAALRAELAERGQVRYWLTGPAEDGYGPTLDGLLADPPVPVTLGRTARAADAYAAADLVVMPSTWEGFGNPVIEAAAARRLVAAADYAVLAELRTLGLCVLPLDEPAAVSRMLTDPERRADVTDANAAVVARHFALADLPARLDATMHAMGWTAW